MNPKKSPHACISTNETPVHQGAAQPKITRAAPGSTFCLKCRQIGGEGHDSSELAKKKKEKKNFHYHPHPAPVGTPSQARWVGPAGSQEPKHPTGYSPLRPTSPVPWAYGRTSCSH